MSKCLKKVFAITIALAILIACIPTVSVFAATLGGTCGVNVNWSLDTASGILTISGSGAMSNYEWSNDAPWHSQSGSIKSVNIENGITSIGEFAFSGCSSLTSITIPDSVTSIGYGAFGGCSSLTYVDIPDSVTSINNYTFNGCSSLTSITIPDSVTSIGYGAFDDTAYYNNEDNWTNDVLFIDNHLIEAKDSLSGEYIIPAGTKTIAVQAFYFCVSLKSITIPNSVTSIGSYTFYDCSSLTSITIPDSVTSIGYGAFYDCSSLTSVSIPDSVTSIGGSAFTGTAYYNNEDNWTNDVLFIDNHLIKAKYSLSGEYIIPAGTKTIAYSAFEDCSSLTSITIPDSVTSIDNYTFDGCSSLASVTIPDSVTSIGNGAFSSCSSLTSVTIPNSVTSIGNWAFEGCSSLTYVTIPDSVTSIGGYAFRSCSSLTSVTIPDSVTSIDSGAFNSCSSLTSVTIPDSITGIGYAAFEDCSSLTSVTIPDSVTSIGWGAFNDTAYYNNKDNWIDDVLFIDNHLIEAKDSLSGEYIIPAGTKTIAVSAFYGCSSLTSVDIPNSVTSIGNGAFSGCRSLVSINVDSENQAYSSHNGILFNKNKTVLILCPSSRTGEYTIPDSVTSIGNSAFSGCSSLTSITIPDSVTSIGYDAFYNCVDLTIRCYENSMAHNYVIENNIPYELISVSLVGDINGDGRINNKDLGLLMQKLNGWTVEIDDAVADVNADGKVNNKDYGLLMQYVNGWDVEIG